MARAEVSAAVKAYLGTAFNGIPVRYPNEASGEPPADNSNFIEVQFPVASNLHVGMAQVGNRTFRETGIIRLVLSTQRGVDGGEDAALAIMGQLEAAFLAKQFGGVTTRTPNAAVSDNSNDNGAWWVLSMAVPYFYDYIA